MKIRDKSPTLYQNTALKVFILSLFFNYSSSDIFAQELPLGYISYYSNKCSNKSFFNSWNTDKPAQWKIISLKSDYVLSGIPADSLINSDLPETRGIISDLIFGDFIIEFEFKISAKAASDSSGFYFLGPVKSSQEYYAIAFTTDSLMFFYIEDSISTKIASKQVSLLKNSWNKVRIKRNILTRQLQIIVNNKSSEQIVFTDRNLVMGYIGFGTHQMTSYLRKINVWAPTSITDTSFVWF